MVDRVCLINSFKKFIMSELKYYNLLSKNNKVRIKLEKKIGYDLIVYYKYIKSRKMTLNDIDDLKNIWRDVLGLQIMISDVEVNNNNIIKYKFINMIVE